MTESSQAERHNVSVTVSDNPLEFAPEENMSITMSVAVDYTSSRNVGSYVSYFGVSKGGQYGAIREGFSCGAVYLQDNKPWTALCCPRLF